MEDNSTLPIIGAVYKHYKGGLYLTRGLCSLESDPSITMVIYQETGGNKGWNKMWVRPLEEFMETVKDDKGDIVNRFQYQ